MKKIVIAVLILLFLFAAIRIGTSTYENKIRDISTSDEVKNYAP